MFDTASLALTAPELILSIGGTILMLVAAFAGDKSTRFVTWASVLLFGAAGLSLTGVAGAGGSALNGLYTADAFGAFAKVLVYVAAAVSILVAPRWFEREDRLRAEYPVLILLSAVGMGMMASATNLLSFYVGRELQCRAALVLACFMRRDTRSAEADV